MNSERWRRIEELVHAALERDAAQRGAFLRDACNGDEDLRREVESLLAQDASGVQERPAVEVAASLLADSSVTQSVVGAPLSSVAAGAADGNLLAGFDGPPLLDQRYELRRKLGGGGMGVVYLAHHRGLHRDVAIKVIKPTRRGSEFAARFRTEAAALGALKHPHIVDVTDFGVDPRGDGIPYLVLELLQGVTLAQKVRAGAISLDDALPILTAIAGAIDFAHDHGVLHRDIKPENIFLVHGNAGRPDVKVLDFGVARIGADQATAVCCESTVEAAAPADRARAEPDRGTSASVDDVTGSESESSDAATRTVTVSVTMPGEILGTLSYLGPELFAGESASRASDIYAFGVLTYEALAGKLPFNIASVEAARDQLARVPPPAHTANGALDTEISPVLAWPLSKDPAARPRTAGELVDALRRAHYLGRVRGWRRTEFPRRRRLSAAVAALLCVAAWLTDGTSALRPLERRLLDAQFHFAPAFAPDSRLTVIVVDDRSLAQDPALLGERADEFADRLEQIYSAGASGVAVDFLLPQRWSSSSRFSRLVLTHADHLALGALSAPNGTVIGPECVAGLTAAALGPARTSALFGFVNVDPDSDDVIRRGRLFFRDVTGSLRDSFSTRSIRAGFGDGAVAQAVARQRAQRDQGTFLIDASVDRSRLRVLSWSSVPDLLMHEPALFQGRFVLIGGDFIGAGDMHWLSGRDARASGVVLQAVIANTILEALPFREVGIVVLLPLMALAEWVTADRTMRAAHFEVPIRTFVCIAVWVIAAMASFLIRRWVVPIVIPVAMIAAAGTMAVTIRPWLRPFPRVEA